MHIGLKSLLNIEYGCPAAGYRLSFDEHSMSIVFSVPLIAEKWLIVAKEKSYFSAEDYTKHFGIRFFDHHQEQWGFDGTIRTAYREHWIDFLVPIPENIEEQNSPIPSTEGFSRILRAGLSISVLAQIFNLMPQEYFTKLPYKQVLVFETYLSPEGGLANFPASVFYSRLVAEWTSNEPRIQFYSLASFLDKVNGHMFPSQQNVSEVPRATVERYGEFYLNFESSHRVGFITDGSKYSPNDFDQGYWASICNPDNPYDQLQCVAALARLYEMVENRSLG